MRKISTNEIAVTSPPSWPKVDLRASRKDICRFLMEGDSMEPMLRTGDILFVDQNEADMPCDGVYVLRADETILVKRLQRLPSNCVLVSSENPAYETFELDPERHGDEFTIVGRVIGFAKRM